MDYNLVVIFSFSIVLAGIIGLFRFKKISLIYYSFIFLLWFGFLNEVISFILIKSNHSNAINSNIYVLLESVLIVWFFKTQTLFERAKKVANWMILFYIVIWCAQNFYFSSIINFSSYFTIVYSFITVLMSINLINRLISNEKGRIFRNSAFLICIGFILFYTCSVLIEIFWIYGLNSSLEFRFHVYRVMTFINLIVNLIYALAVLWIPKKREYTLL